ncbi:MULTISPECIES: TIGR03619 family F420-dependent LLM class oxidoreductase [unclassified Nocardioides]|uniref:TIGR03619 family F420-dependent LLM class oxidoreductase n=1 Tax=unclassified Nocardioides TaxID=2615069 RepID=UPI0006FE4D4D|nr:MULTISPECIES: TIGR03619 family F420-dependent LLM class oxidoreductase [unclassified Nocardioides]KQY54290.1 LLM class F420-dependent oxidoreductase [Nocardioides sp. Root140]KQZ74913.1 LLM class F420-dependent oxidoreductase [Nocardioides sp. Root151]KRF10446.1 LLM class F420-dependent oxidoreductase [Nocardioides sp. Soil796]
MKWALSGAMMGPKELLEVAVAAEELGYDGVGLSDSVFYPEKVSADYPYTADGKRMWSGETPMPDPFVMMSALAAVTERLIISTNVLKLPLRDPLLTAKQVATMAVLSDNRIALGVGLSWIPEEFTFTGTDMRTRGARTDEAIAIIKSVCAGNGPEWVEHHGKHYDFDRLMISPAPDRPVPVYVGGHSEAGLKRAARIGDGWISVNVPADELKVAIARLGVLREEYGRADLPFEIDVSPTDVHDVSGYRDLEEAGVTICRVSPWRMFGEEQTTAGRIESLRRFAETVIGKY